MSTYFSLPMNTQIIFDEYALRLFTMKTGCSRDDTSVPQCAKIQNVVNNE
jgi:hypothetical protein